MNEYTRRVQAFAREQAGKFGRGMVLVYQTPAEIEAFDYLTPAQVDDACWSPQALVEAVEQYDVATEFVASQGGVWFSMILLERTRRLSMNSSGSP